MRIYQLTCRLKQPGKPAQRIIFIFPFLFILSLSYSQSLTSKHFDYAIVKSDTFARCAVSCAHPLASRAGVSVMRQGGNAFDAAIATQLALAVVYPNAGNLGGGGFLLGRTKKGDLVGLDYRETAPSSADRDMYLSDNGEAQTQLSQNGHLAAGVPGTVAGLFATLKYARLPFAKLIRPAIELAERGFIITEKEAAGLNAARDAFLRHNTTAIAFVKADRWKAGDRLVQKELAMTLRRILQKGAAGFYEGKTAQLIVEEMKKGKGIITAKDLKNYKVKYRRPIRFDYRGYEIISFPPPSSGGILLAQMLKMVEPYPLGSYGFQSPQAVQLMTEAERRAYADRATYMADPDFWNVPQDKLISDVYLRQRMSDYRPDRAGSSQQVTAGILPEHEETTHVSIADAEGNLVSLTTTLNGLYGCKVVVGGAGFFLNNEMDDFSIKPGVPNMYGAVGGEANAIAPGKRMLSSMTPSLVLQKGQPYLVVGTPGGTTIPTSVFQTIVNVLDFQLSAQDAVDLPKFHHQWLPDEVVIEKGFSAKTATALKNMGYKLSDRNAIGRTELILLLPDQRKIAVADSRGDDSVDGF